MKVQGRNLVGFRFKARRLLPYAIPGVVLIHSKPTVHTPLPGRIDTGQTHPARLPSPRDTRAARPPHPRFTVVCPTRRGTRQKMAHQTRWPATLPMFCYSEL